MKGTFVANDRPEVFDASMVGWAASALRRVQPYNSTSHIKSSKTSQNHDYRFILSSLACRSPSTICSTLVDRPFSCQSFAIAGHPRHKMSANTPHRAARISPERWEQMKTAIHQLYVVEDRTLTQIIRIMCERHNFIATYAFLLR